MATSRCLPRQRRALAVGPERRRRAREFHRQTRNGTLYNATGTAHLTDRQVDRSLFGTLEPEVAFHAEKLERPGRGRIG